MFQRPVYRTSLVLLTLAAVAGAAWLIAMPRGAPGIEITVPGDAPGLAREAGGALAGDAERHIDINAASALERAEALPGIGPVLSERIVAHREANGPFARVDQLLGVRGIGAATYERLRPLITAGE